MGGTPPKVCRICRYADGVCTAGFRKHHERADPQCRLHGSSSRGNRPARPQVPALREEEEPQPAGGATGGSQLDEMTHFATRKGLHMLYRPEALDKWIGRDIRQTQKGDYSTGEILGQPESKEYEQYRQRFLTRCKVGGKADRLVRIVDRYMPRVSAENRVYTMRFPDKVHDMLRKARAIRRRIRARKGGQQMPKPDSHRSETGKQPHRRREDRRQSRSSRPRGRTPTPTCAQTSPALPRWGRSQQPAAPRRTETDYYQQPFKKKGAVQLCRGGARTGAAGQRSSTEGHATSQQCRYSTTHDSHGRTAARGDDRWPERTRRSGLGEPKLRNESI